MSLAGEKENDAPKLPSHEERFKANVIYICQILSDILVETEKQGIKIPFDPILCVVMREFIKGINAHAIIDKFISRSYAHWPKIKEKKDDHLMENAMSLFEGLPKEKVDSVKELFTLEDANGDKVINEKYKEKIWKISHALVKISIKYIHEKRVPKPNREGVMRYTEVYYKEIRLGALIQEWGVTM